MYKRLISAVFFVLLSVVAHPVALEAEALRLAVPTPYPAKGHPFETYRGGSLKSALYDGLTQISLTGEVAPALAVSWTAESATEWVFSLRPGVQFHNGAPLTAKAVAAVLDYAIKPESQRFWVAQYLTTVRSVHVVDPLTVRIITKSPDPLLARRMSIVRIADMQAWGEQGEFDFAENPVGTGAYRVVSWGPNATRVQLEAFDQAWRSHNDVRSIDMRVVPDGSRRVQALLSGEIDLAVNLDPDAIVTLESAGLKTEVVPNPIIIVIGMITEREGNSPLLDKRVRQAVNYAVNKTQIVKFILGDKMTVATQAATPGVVGYDSAIQPYTYDPGRARGLLESAGYPDGFDLVVTTWGGMVPGDTLIFQQMAQDLAAVGIRTELRQTPMQEHARKLTTGDWGDVQMTTTTMSSRHLFDSLTALESVSCNRRPFPYFCDPQLDRVIDAARYVMNPIERQRLMQAAMATAVETAPVLFLVNYSDVVAMKPGISGYEVRSDGILFEKLRVN